MKSFSILTEQKYLPQNGNLSTILGANIEFNDNILCIMNTSNQQQRGSFTIEYNDNPADNPCICTTRRPSQSVIEDESQSGGSFERA